MINTIFYFAPDLSLTDYQALVDQDNGIAARTIVFASAQKAIYKGGQQYSVGDISSDISSYLTTNKYLKEGDQYFARFLTQQNLDGYLTSADLLPYALTSSLNEFYNNASYSNGILTLTKKGGGTTPITISDTNNTALGQLLTSLNSMNNPTAQDTNKTLVWNGNSWTYGTSSGGTTYNAGSGIVINNNTISLKTSTSLTGLNGDRNYPVQTDSNGVPYVNVNWFSNTTQGNYVVNISPDTILVPTDSDGTGTIGNTTCHVTVSLNGEDVPIDQNGIVVGTITRSDNNTVGNTITALPSGNTVIVSVTNATSFAKKTAQIPVNIYVGGVNISTQYIQLTGMAKAPVSGADAISLWTSVEIVHLSYDRSAISVNEISVGMLRGNSRMSNSETQTAGYSIWYKFSEQQTYTLLSSSLSSKSISTNEELTSSSVTFVLCHGTDAIFSNNSAVITKQIPFVVDPAPAIGTPQYQINILSNSIQYKEGETNYSGTIQFQLLKDGIALTGQEPTENSQTLGYFKIYCGNSTIPVWNQTPNQSAVSTYSLSTDQNNYTYSITISGQNPDIYYTSVQFINGATILASTVVPFIVEGANGTTTTQIQPLSGVVTRIIDILDDAPFTSSADVYDEQGATNGSNVVNHGTWYAGNVPDNNGITYLDILHYRTRTGNENDGYTYVDHGYFRPRTTNSHIAPVIVYNDGTTSSTYINYTVHGAVVNGGNYYTNHSTLLTIEWEVFNTMPDSVFNHMLANSAYIQNLTVAKDLVITDGERNPTAGITGTSSTINTANGGTVTTGQGDIRIWAGYPTDNNLYNCPFYVTNEGILHAKQAIIEHGTLVEKVTFERRDAYKIENNSYEPLQLARRLYEVTRGNTLTSNNSGGSAYDVESLKLTTNHLIILSRGAYKSDPLLIQYAGDSHQELHLLLPPPHYVIGQSITITNESEGLQKADDSDPAQIVLKQENIRYIEDGQLETRYPKQSRNDASCILLTGVESGNPTQGQVTQEGTVQITTDGTNTEKLSGIWILDTIQSANGTYKQGTVVNEIVLDNYAWITVTAAEGYQKEDYSNMSDNIKKLNAMWVVTGYAYKE